MAKKVLYLAPDGMSACTRAEWVQSHTKLRGLSVRVVTTMHDVHALHCLILVGWEGVSLHIFPQGFVPPERAYLRASTVPAHSSPGPMEKVRCEMSAGTTGFQASRLRFGAYVGSTLYRNAES